MNLRTAIVALCGLLLLAGCGGGGASDPLAGTYVLDVEKTLSASGTAKPDAASLQAIQADFTPDAYRFELGDDTFALTVGTASSPLVVEGTWERTAGGLTLTHTDVNGQDAAPEGGAPLTSTARVEGDWIVLQADGQEIWLRKT